MEARSAPGPDEELTALVVQPDPEVGAFLRHQLQALEIQTTSVTDTDAAREQLGQSRFDLVVCDLDLPHGPAVRLAEEVRRRWPAIATIVVSALDDPAAATAAIAHGVDDCISRPLSDQRVELAIARALRRRDERAAARASGELAQRQPLAEEALARLARAGRFRDEETAEHVERMSRSCAVIAYRLGWDHADCARLRAAAALHDIGKVGVPDSVLRKPGRLNAEERSAVEEHAQIGHDILIGSEDGVVKLAATIALTHHERFDGTGYPQRLEGHAIPIAGRIAAVADVFDALTHDRIYRSAFSLHEALEMMREQNGAQFDPSVFEAFEAVLPQLEEVAQVYVDGVQGDDRPLLFAGPESPTRVLFVEEHPVDARGLELLLRREGFEVAGTAPSVADAERMLTVRAADIAIVSLDLPDDGWLQFVPAAKQRGVSVLLYTSETDPAGIAAAHAAGADAVVAKSGSPTEFVEAVRAVARGLAHPDPRPTPDFPKPARARLTARESEIVSLLGQGLTGEQIAERLFLSPATVQTHIRNARERIGAKTRSHLVALVTAAN